MNSTTQSVRSKSLGSRLNQTYIIQYIRNRRIVLIAHCLQLFIAFITVLLLTFLLNFNFRYGFYLLPICVVLSIIQIMFMIKGNTYPAFHWVYQLIAFGALAASFLSIYFYVYNPTFSQSFTSAENCEIIKQRQILLEDGSYQENYQVLTIQFTDNSMTYKGCGCGSNKYHESLFQTKIEPFRYVSNSETDSLNAITLKEDSDISAIKMPSWMCSYFQDYEDRLAAGSVSVQKCYFNYYGDRNEAFEAQTLSDYCSKSSNFFQVILTEQPYYPLDQFLLLLGCSLIPLFGLSFNWIFVILLHTLCPFLRCQFEQSNEITKNSTAKVTPKHESNHDTDNISSAQQQQVKSQHTVARKNPLISSSPHMTSESGVDLTTNDIHAKNNHVNAFFTLPTAKKRFLPPISLTFNYENTIKENVKLEIETNKELINLQPKSKQFGLKENIEVIVSNSSINLPSIFHKNNQIGPKKSCKVQFKQTDEESAKLQNPS